jgi:alkylation response protein AidB-like acyl-CoA dehydrogenase
MQTKAVEDGDSYVLNGSKIFITNGKEADIYVIFAVTGMVEKRGRLTKEISAFIVEKGTPGFGFGTKEKKMGIRGSSTYELIFTDCRIPKENLLGVKGKGFNMAMHTLDGGRIGIASQALGIAEGALERTIDYTKERKQFGRSISAFQNTQFQLADMATRVQAAQLLVYKAAMAKATQKTYSVEAAMAKLYAAEVAMYVTTKAVQLHGGYGYTREYDVERMMRDAKITEIYEGTSEVQRMVISGSLLK